MERKRLINEILHVIEGRLNKGAGAHGEGPMKNRERKCSLKRGRVTMIRKKIEGRYIEITR